MSVSKALSQAPQGLAALPVSGVTVNGPNDPNDPEVMEIIVEGEYEEEEDAAPDEADNEGFNANLAETISDEQLTLLSNDLLGEFNDDLSSRKDWIQTYVDGIELLGLKFEDRTEPWPGACGVYHPLLSEAVVKFQAETMMDTFPAAGPVKTQVIGKETREKMEAASRVKEDMNYQLTDRMVEYRPEHERMLWGLGLAGNAFKKVYYDPTVRRQVSIFVPAEDVVVPYGASNLQTSPRITHVMRKTPNEVKKLQVAKFYRDVDLGDPTDTFDDVEKKIAEKMGFRASTDDRHKLLEMHVDVLLKDYAYDKDNTGKFSDIALPYVVTLDKATGTILAIRRNWREKDKSKRKREHFVHYSYVPGFGFYAFGLIHLVGAFAKSGTSILRQLVDAGTLSNLPGGFKTKGLRVKGDDTPVGPGEWRDVDVASGVLKDNIIPLPYKEPSMVLQSLLTTIVDEGRRFAGAADLKISDMSAQSPVGTTLAILERTLKVMSAVQARIHYAMKQELQLLKEIIRDYTPNSYSYEPDEGQASVKQSDYDLVEVIPVSDPNAATMAQKVVQYQAVMQLSQTAPQLYDLPYLHRQMLEVLGLKDANKLVPMEDDMKPVDPVSENMAVLKGKPIKAFIGQDHEAHLAVHISAMQDPQLAAAMGQNPQAQTIMMAMQSHITEHLGFAYRKQIEEMAGVPYPAPDAPMDQNTEIQISRLAAAAAQKLLQKHTAEQQAAIAQQQAQDPLVQLQQAELKIKEMEAQIKQQKLALDAATAADKIEVDRERIASAERIAGLNAGIKVASDKAHLSAEQQREGVRMGVDIARTIAAEDRQKNDAKEQRVVTERMKNKDHMHDHLQREKDRAAEAEQKAKEAEMKAKEAKPSNKDE